MKTSNNFVKAENIGRKALKEVLKNESICFSDDDFCPYDAYVDDVKDGKKIKYLIEIKIRHSHYDSYMINQTKLKGLERMKLKYLTEGYDDVILLYLNFTPKGTYIWNIEKVIKQLKMSTAYAAITTAEPSDKVIKQCYYLPIDKAIRKYDYIISQ